MLVLVLRLLLFNGILCRGATRKLYEGVKSGKRGADGGTGMRRSCRGFRAVLRSTALDDPRFSRFGFRENDVGVLQVDRLSHRNLVYFYSLPEGGRRLAFLWAEPHFRVGFRTLNFGDILFIFFIKFNY